MAFGLGPVFEFEWLVSSRRWRSYAMRSATVLFLLGPMWIVWSQAVPAGEMSIAQQAELSKSFFGTTAIILLGLVGLAAPAATAGSICLDKANLTLLMASDLSDAEIVLGKLAARLVPVLGLILCATPVLSLATLFGAIDPAGVVGALFVVLSCAVFGCTLALTLSIWGQKTHEVLLATYLFGILYLAAAPILAMTRGGLPGWLPKYTSLLEFNPVYLVIAVIAGTPPGMRPVTLVTHAMFLGLGLLTSAVLIIVATLQIRPVVIRQMGERASRRWSIASFVPGHLLRFNERIGPSLDRNPVLWRECHRQRPSRWGLVLWGSYAVICGGLTLYCVTLMIEGRSWGRDLGIRVNAAQAAIGLLMLSVSAATSLAEERQRGSLDVLMSTPLSTRSIVWGKWWGTFRLAPRLLILPLPLTLALSVYTRHFWGAAVMAGLILAYGAAITSVGLALATWMPRIGRVVGTTVGLYTTVCIGWIPLNFSIFGDGDKGMGMVAASPLMGVGMYGAMLAGDYSMRALTVQTFWTVFWMVAYCGIAVALLLATLGTFDRCLGRVTMTPEAACR